MSHGENSEEKLQRLSDIRAKVLRSGTKRERRDLVRDAIDRQTWQSYYYRFLPDKFPLEYDIRLCLDVFGADGECYPREQAIADLKLLRRVAMQRLAFDLAGTINHRLQNEGESRMWLWKDFALPRLGLAIPLGYLAVFGGPYPWIWEIRGHLGWVYGFTILLAMLSMALIYLNVRDKVGRLPEAFKRSLIAFAIGVAWCGFYVGSAYSVVLLFYANLRHLHAWPAAILTTAFAYFLAVLLQFFFPQDSSIANPL